MIAGGGVTINGVRVADPAFVPEPIAGEWLDVRIGKRRREIGRRARLSAGRRRGRRREPACRRPQDVDRRRDGGEAALGEQHQGVVDEVGGLAGERLAGRRAVRARRLGRGVVLGRDQDLGGLLGDLAGDGVHAAVEQDVGVRAGRSLGARATRSSPTASRARRSPAVVRSAGAPSGSKQLRVPAMARRTDRIDA